MLKIKSVMGGYVESTGFVVGWDDENGTNRFVKIKDVDADGISPRVLAHALRCLVRSLERIEAEGTQ